MDDVGAMLPWLLWRKCISLSSLRSAAFGISVLSPMAVLTGLLRLTTMTGGVISRSSQNHSMTDMVAWKNSVVPNLLTSDVLIVDDTINNLRLLSDILSQSGFSVRKAISGSMALTAIQASKPDLILLDINMPGMNGYEVCERLKQNSNTQEIPIIFISASDMTADKIKAFRMGGTDYITKPFNSEEVVVRIQNQLLLSQLRAELTDKNKVLEQTLSDLKRAQVEIIQKEKMLGLNQLIAGLSHEINNPMSFIMGNLEPAKQYFYKLLSILNLYRQRYPEPDAEIEAAIATADLDFIIHDFSSVMRSMEKGTSRICDIIQALHTFSHHGESTFKTINLNTAIDSVLMLLKPRLRGHGNRPSIQLSPDYGDLPSVTCDAGLISQAILHVLDNAIDAINIYWEGTQASREIDHTNLEEPKIAIKTGTLQPDQVTICIRDNGIGIEDAIKPRIYEPFFTTKSTGQGHGLGLSITYQIIVGKHQGSLAFTSTRLKGSEFVLQLPIHMAM